MQRGIVLVNMPKLLREIVRDVLAGEPDLEIMSELDDDGDLFGVLEQTGARHVVWGGNGHVPQVEPVLQRFPTVRVLAILDDGRRGFLYELRPHRRALGQLSPERLVSAIREAAA